ncbi:MAG: hypothetical protein RL347_349 [Actinomycetota bacterium]|jgi:DNA-binding winged helix-turn-helix (wHTH) protein
MEDIVSGVAREPRLTVNRAARRVLLDGAVVSLTRTQFDILSALVSHEGRVLTRAEIMESVWGHSFFSTPDHLSVHIHHIRRALGDTEEEPRFIRTVRGVGYIFMPSRHSAVRQVTLHFDSSSILVAVDPHETFLGWDPDDLLGRFFSLAGLDETTTAVILAEARRRGGLRGPVEARHADGTKTTVEVTIEFGSDHAVDGYSGRVSYPDGSEPAY